MPKCYVCETDSDLLHRGLVCSECLETAVENILSSQSHSGNVGCSEKATLVSSGISEDKP